MGFETKVPNIVFHFQEYIHSLYSHYHLFFQPKAAFANDKFQILSLNKEIGK